VFSVMVLALASASYPMCLLEWSLFPACWLLVCLPHLFLPQPAGQPRRRKFALPSMPKASSDSPI